MLVSFTPNFSPVSQTFQDSSKTVLTVFECGSQKETVKTVRIEREQVRTGLKPCVTESAKNPS